MSSALNRIKDKLNKSKDNSNFYEAHQLYTTLYHRYTAKKRDEDARNLLVEGAEYLFANNQPGSGAQLSLLYVESLENNVTERTDTIISVLAKLHSLMPCNLPELEMYDKRAILWSAKCKNAPSMGDKTLRLSFAVTYWKNKMYAEARQNFLYSDDGAKFGEMLLEFSIHHGLPSEIDLFLAQAVLQLLCLQSYQAANQVFSLYTKQHPKICIGPPFNYPLVNFLCFLLIAVEKKQLVIFTILCDQYRLSLQRDTLYFGYLEKIAEHYFGVPSIKRNVKPDFLDNLINSLFDDDDEQDLDSRKANKQMPNITMTIEDLD